MSYHLSLSYKMFLYVLIYDVTSAISVDRIVGLAPSLTPNLYYHSSPQKDRYSAGRKAHDS